MIDSTLELRTREIGRELFAAAARTQPGVGSAGWWDEMLMGMSMRDEGLKVQLFRFIDVLPALKRPRQISRHLREYLEQAQGRLPGLARAAVGMMPQEGWGGKALAAAARFNAHRLARRFIAGTDLHETIEAIERLRRRHMAFTIDLLGEAILAESEAGAYQKAYLGFIDGLAHRAAHWPEIEQLDRAGSRAIARVNVSIKLSGMYSQFDPIDPAGTSRAVRDKLRPILRLARQAGAFVNIDMEQHAFKDLTLRIFQEILEEGEFRDWADVGIAIQVYLRSSGEDLSRLLRWAEKRAAPVGVRLVKGAYWDYETTIARQQGWESPVFEQKAETDANFETQTAFLIEHHDLLRPAIASHNVRSIAHALALVEEKGVAERSVEFQLLYGMADPIKAALAQRGQRVRVYMPFGQLLPGMAYLVRRLLENTSNQSFLRAGFLEHVPMERLLMNPMNLIKRSDAATKRRGDEGKGSGIGFRVSGIGKGESGFGAFSNEPLSDFSRADCRATMEQALEEVGRKLGQTVWPMVEGREIHGGRMMESINPSHSGQVVGRCGCATVEDVNRAVAAAKAAFPAWRETAVEERARLLMRAAQIMRRQRFELAAWEVYECGKQWREADSDVAEAIDYSEYYAREMIRLSRPQHRDVPGEANEYFYEPRGVSVTIAPWNFPLAILCGMTTAALAAGNTAIMKPAEQSTVVGAKLMEVFGEAGFPAGVVGFLPGVGEEIGPSLVEHPDVAVVAFTGSRGVGLGINRSAAEVRAGQEHMKRVIVELGGKNAIIVDEDADLDEAVHGVAASAFGYAGQKCSACSRVIVLESIDESFLDRLVEVTRSLRIGPAEDPGSFIGPVIDAEAQRRVLDYIETGRKEARLAYAGDVSALADEGFYVGPHIFADVPPRATIAQEEIFGPVLATMRARDLTQSLELANGSRYALTGGFYSRSPANIARVRREFRVGNLYINRKITGALVDRQPFGGFKLSGIGSKAGGPDYLSQFLLPRTITENTLRHGFAPAEEGAAEARGGGEMMSV